MKGIGRRRSVGRVHGYARAMARVLLLTGPVGVGKTTTLHEIEALLGARGIPNAIVDLDWLAWASPDPASGTSVHDILLANAAAVWATFHRAGIAHLAVARALHDAAEIAALRAAFAGAETFVVELDAARDVLEERIRQRDVGVELDEHLALLADCASPGVADAIIDAEQPPRQVALEVLGAAGWV